MSQTIDVNVLLYASNEQATEHRRANDLLHHLAAGPDLTVLLWPVVMGYLRIATHPSVFSDPLPHDVALANIESLLSLPHLRAVGETERFLDAYRRTTTGVRVKGNLVPDAQIVALMREHGVNIIWSRDRDLRRFDGVRVQDPFAARYDDGFEARPTGGPIGEGSGA